MNPSTVSTSPVVPESISLEPFSYSLDHECPVPWPSQDNAVSKEYPFHCDDGSPHEFVMKRYLETLWLPESIMPLPYLVKSLRRVVFSSSRAKAVHSAIEPLLLSVRATHDKYHTELPRILQDGCGAGDTEEAMMWYSWSRESFQPGGTHEGNDADRSCEDAGKKSWMEQKERREVQIQILLYFHLISVLSISENAPVTLPKKRRKQIRGPPSPIKSFKSSTADVDEGLRLEDRLEFLMDKLSLWQLMASLTPSGSSYPSTSQPKANTERDWMQKFCEDVVEPLFRDRLPELCDLLRTKVFPHSPFSEDSDGAPSRPPIHPAKKRKTKGKRPPSPLRLQELAKSQSARSRAGSTQPPVTPIDSRDSGAPQRDRSRSRSVSVSVEEVRARGANRGGVTNSKNLWKGEVEMKRTSSRGSKLFEPLPVSSQTREAEKTTRYPSTMPSEAPSCAPEPRSPSQLKDPRTLAVDTPVKKKTIKVEDTTMPDNVMDSPDELLLTNKLPWHDLDENDTDTDEGGLPVPLTTIFAADTPVKKRK